MNEIKFFRSITISGIECFGSILAKKWWLKNYHAKVIHKEMRSANIFSHIRASSRQFENFLGKSLYRHTRSSHWHFGYFSLSFFSRQIFVFLLLTRSMMMKPIKERTYHNKRIKWRRESRLEWLRIGVDFEREKNLILKIPNDLKHGPR